MITPPTYGMYEISAKIQGARIIEIPLIQEKSFALDNTAILNTWEPTTKLIFLCSPNNPTGNLLGKSAILSLCAALKNQALIIVDEAYVEFSDLPSLSAELSNYENLVVLRTLSKAYGLAGVRCGVALANSAIIELLKKIIAPYPISCPVIDTVINYLTTEQIATIKQQIVTLKRERDNLLAFLSNLPSVITVWPSAANFLLAKVNDAKTWLTTCLQYEIAIRDRSQMLGLTNCVRISVGTPEENQILKEILSCRIKK